MDIDALLEGHTPLAVGAALTTPGGRLRARSIIHVANTPTPGEDVQVEDVARATAAVIVACEVRQYNSVAIPLMGAFEGGIPAEEAARAIHSEFRGYRGERPSRVVLLARTPDEVEIFELAVDGLG